MTSLEGHPQEAARRGPQEAVAHALAAVGGYVDAVGYVALFQLFTAHQSGNSAGLGVALAGGDWTEAWRRGLSIASFVAGVCVGTALVELSRALRLRSTGVLVGLAEIAALASALGLGQAAAHAGRIAPADTSPYALAAACLAGAMGVQTVALRRVGKRSLRTTFVTGVLTNFAESLVVSCFRHDHAGRGRLRRLSRLLGSVWALYMGGAVAGAAAQSAWSFASLAVPIAVVGVVTAWQARARYRPGLPE